MKKSTQKNVYVAVTAGLGLLAMSSASADISILDEDADFIPGGVFTIPVFVDGVRWEADDGSTNSVAISGHQGAVTASNGAGNSTRVGHSAVVGSHAGLTSRNNWKFDENGFTDTIDDTPVLGTKVNTTTRTIDSTQNGIANGTDTTFRNQTATAQYDEAKDNVVGGNIASRNQTKFGQTDTAAIGGHSAVRRQTATTQDDEIVDTVTGFSNKQKSTVAGTERTVVGGAGTTRVTQTDILYDIDADTRVRRGLRVDGMANLNGGLTVGAGKTVNMGGNRVQNVADGVADFDAVNFRQLNNLDKKLTGKINETGAVAAAFAQLGQAQTPGKSTFGIAAGGQGSKAGIAVGMSHRPITRGTPVVIKVSLGASGKTVAGGVGATWEF